MEEYIWKTCQGLNAEGLLQSFLIKCIASHQTKEIHEATGKPKILPGLIASLGGYNPTA